MKQFLFTAIALASVLAAGAQQREGKITYERTVQMRIQLSGMGDMPMRDLPQSRTEKMMVLFGNNQSIRKTIVEETPEPTGFDQGPVVVTRFGGGDNDVNFYDYNQKKGVQSREFAGKKYLVTDTAAALEWKLTGESKTVLGLPCQQAKTVRIATRASMMMMNGEMKRTEVQDTMHITAWFTPAIPVSIAPEYQGQLPGAILEIDVNNGRTVYKAIEISPKVDLAQIKEPKSGKKVTAAEFAAEQAKVMEDMRKNSGGRMQSFRMN